MKTTIVIPNYNGKAFMEDCLTALAAQTVRDFEVLVVDLLLMFSLQFFRQI